MNTVYWTPPVLSTTAVGRFIQQVNGQYGVSLQTYEDLYQWSVTEIPSFWKLLLQESGIAYQGALEPVLSEPCMWPRPTWFEQVTCNVAQAMLEAGEPEQAALLYQIEDRLATTLTYTQLRNQVAQLAHWFKQNGLCSGDVVAGFISNCPEAIVAMLAAASLGAIWTSCSPDSGTQFAYDRFEQTRPQFLVAVDAYFYDGKWVDVQDKALELQEKLGTKALVLVQRLPGQAQAVSYTAIVDDKLPVPALHFEQMPFSHPLYILYSSGTTGKPKCIVHSAGGTLLQHIKEHRLQCDLKPGDRLLYFTTTSWMMWNWMVSALASGVTLILFEGKPVPQEMWNWLTQLRVTAYGTSSPWISMCKKVEVHLPTHALPDLRLMLSTGGPLLKEHFEYVYTHIKSTIQLASISGGTDIISCFAGGGPVPVQSGRLQCAGLGMKVAVWNEAGQPVLSQEGELVCTAPFPCMPIYFFNDLENTQYKAAYFEKFEGVWAHGDFAILYPDNSLEILGRSDSTIKRKGVRIGTSDIYNVLENISQIDDALAVGRKNTEGEDIVLFLKLKSGEEQHPSLKKEVRSALMAHSPFLKPDYLFFVSDIPYTANGKKSEIIVKNILNGRAITNQGILRNAECLAEYYQIGTQIK